MADKNTIPSTVGDLTQVQRAAVVLLTLGEHDAVEVLKHMNQDEVQKIGSAMATVRDISFDLAYTVMDEFVEALRAPPAIGANADEMVRAIMIKTLGEDRATGVLDRMERNTSGLDPLKWMEPRSIADLIRNEHPQIVAILMSHLEPEQSANVLKHIPGDVRQDIMLRIATLDGIPPHALNELNELMQKRFDGSETVRSSNIGGVKVAANILNLLESGQEEGILGHIDSVNAELGSQIRELMFVFDNLLDLDARTIQVILREVSQERLGVALRGADERVKTHILGNMSKRAGDILIEDMEARGPVRVTEVESAQKEILSVVRRLADEGSIQLAAKAEALI